MHPIKSQSVNQISPVIENELYLSRRQRLAKTDTIPQQFRLRSRLVPVLQQRDARVCQRFAKPAQKLRATRRRNPR